MVVISDPWSLKSLYQKVAVLNECQNGLYVASGPDAPQYLVCFLFRS